MLKVDLRRMLRSRLFYIMIACALLVPIVMTVMLTMMDGSESTNPQTGEVTVIEGPESVWESIGSLPADGKDGKKENEDSAPRFGCGVRYGRYGRHGDVQHKYGIYGSLRIRLPLISDDFRSGYAKNLFTVRAKKGDYVISKTLVGFICGALMLIAYFVGAMLAGAITGLSFALGSLSAANIVMCMLSKVFLMLVFVSIFTLISVAAKQRAWLSICASLSGGMLLFMTVGLITPLSSTVVNLALCLAGGLIFAIALGAVSKAVLNKTSLV